MEGELSVLKDLYDQIAKIIDSVQPIKADSDNESEGRETERVRSDAARFYKRFRTRTAGMGIDLSFISGES